MNQISAIEPQLSIKNRIWQAPIVTDAQVDALVACGANALTAPILAARGISPDDVQSFLAPSIRELLPNPSFFLDMDKAADRITEAILNKEQLAIWSDYDVDGACSGAVLGAFLRECGITNYDIYIPDRIEEGYGPNEPGLLTLQSFGNSLVVVLDSGTTAFEPLEAAAAANLDVVVIDHHTAEPRLPPAVAVVNPNRVDQEKGYGHICAAGMTFILCVAISLRLRQRDFFDGQDGRSATPPALMSYLDLVALATLCDIVPLLSINRAFVLRGLPVLTARNRPGIAALTKVAKCGEEITTHDCGFGLGPRINAGGRIGDPLAGVNLLLEEDPEEAYQMAVELDQLNEKRKKMTEECAEQAKAQLPEDFVVGLTRRLVVAVTDAHEGIVGIAAARLMNSLDAPSFVLAATPEGDLKGSGRSVPGFNLGDTVIEARQKGLLIKGGGHAMAAGITVAEEKLEEFIAFVNAKIEKSDYAKTGVISSCDNIISIRKANLGLVGATQELAPFGNGNQVPKFIIPQVMIANAVLRGNKARTGKTHIMVTLEDPTLRNAGPRLEAPLWNAAGTPFGEAILELKDEVVDCLCSLERNDFGGKTKLRVNIEDVRLSQQVL